MRRNTLFGFLLACFLTAGNTFAATYYISTSTGSDMYTSGQAQSKNTPWAHAPGMANCTNGCAGYVPQPGDKFILKGGDNWGNDSMPWSWNWSGISGSEIYIGVDLTWYTGSVWSRPIMNGQNAQVGSTNLFLSLGGSYVTVDNLEWTGARSNNTYPYGGNAYINPMLSRGVTLSNNYFHGWTNVSTDDWTCIVASSQVEGNPGLIIRNNVFSGKDTAAIQADLNCTGSCLATGTAIFHMGGSKTGKLTGNVFEYMMNFVVGNTGEASYNLFYELRTSTTTGQPNQNHGNVFESLGDPSGFTFHDNVIHTIRVPGYVTLWVMPAIGNTSYVYNNVIVNVATSSNIFNVGDTTPDGFPCCGTMYAFNNTMQCGLDGSPAFPCSVCNSNVAACIYKNNHLITSSSTPLVGGSNLTSVSNLVQPQATANAQGYSFSQFPYKFSPSLAGSTIGAGTDLSSMCTILPGLCKDTSYGPTYNSTAHAATLYGRNVNVSRSSTVSWDVGAYSFGTTTAPAAPTGLQVR